MTGRIPQAFIDDVLERLDIVEVVDRRVPLKRSGRNYSARCPFHDERTPSFTVSPDKQFYYCFGCGAGGNAIGFVMDYERLDFPHAVELLAGSLGLQVPRESRGPGAAPAAPPRDDLYSLMERVANWYRRQLRQHPGAQDAVDYLKGRGLSGIVARDFELGFAPPGWDGLLREFGTDEAGRRRLLEAGLLVEREGGGQYDRFRHRIMFPIRDLRGRVVAFGGRVLGDERPKYLNSPETPLFNKSRELYGLHQARRQRGGLRRVLVVEGYMDVVALAQHGIHYGVATLGTATTTEHLRRLFRQTSEVVFCFDGDDAGRAAAVRALENLLPVMSDGRQARFLFLPEGEDPDSLVRRLGPRSLEARVEEAVPLEEQLFVAAGQGLDLDSMEGRAALTHRALPWLRRLPDSVYRQLMVSALAERTGVALETLQDLLRRPAERHAPPAPESPAPPRPTRQPIAATSAGRARVAGRDPVLYALGLLVLHPQLATRLSGPESLAHLEGPAAELLREVLTMLAARPGLSTPMLIGQWYEEPWRGWLVKAIDCAYFVREESAESELLDTERHLRRTALDQDLASLVDNLRGRNYAELSAEEKQRLRELLARKHHRGTESG